MASMKCERVQRLLADYSVDGLSWILTRRIRNHLQECSFCSKEYQIMMSACEMLDSLPETEVPEYIWENIQRDLERLTANQQNVPSFRYIPAMGLTAICLLLAFAGWLVNKPAAPPPALNASDYGFFIRTHFAGSGGDIMLSDIVVTPLQDTSFEHQEAPSKG